MTVWFGGDAVSGWRAAHSGKRGGQQRYSDLAIEICLILRAVFSLPLRQSQGFVSSLLRLMKLELPVPDYSTLYRRAPSLEVVPDTRTANGPVTLIVDSTGLRVHGGREWMRQKHGLPKTRKTWRKLHIGFDPECGDLVASHLTTEHVSDPGALPDLLTDVAGPVRRFIADGAYDGGPTAATVPRVFGPDVELIIPPPKNAVRGDCAARNAHIDTIAEHGRMTWQKDTGYGQRSRGEAQMERYKHVIGPQLRSRKWRAKRAKVASPSTPLAT